LIVDRIEWTIPKSSILKNEMMQLDILASNDWERPICFVAAGNEGSMRLEAYLAMEGLSYRLVPIKTTGRNFLSYGHLDADTLYNLLMNKFRYGRMEEPDVHLDFYNIRTISVIKLRNKFVRLADELIKLNKMDSARVALDRCMELMPHPKVPFDAFVPPIANAYFNCGAIDEGTALMRHHVDVLLEDLTYYYDLEPESRATLDYEIRLSLQLLQEYSTYTNKFSLTDIGEEIEAEFSNYYQRYMQERR
jgi:hypothetical protein